MQASPATGEIDRGKLLLISGEGDMAKCLCHEIDYLDGRLFIDLVEKYL